MDNQTIEVNIGKILSEIVAKLSKVWYLLIAFAALAFLYSTNQETEIVYKYESTAICDGGKITPKDVSMEFVNDFFKKVKVGEIQLEDAQLISMKNRAVGRLYPERFYVDLVTVEKESHQGVLEALDKYVNSQEAVIMAKSSRKKSLHKLLDVLTSQELKEINVIELNEKIIEIERELEIIDNYSLFVKGFSVPQKVTDPANTNVLINFFKVFLTGVILSYVISRFLFRSH